MKAFVVFILFLCFLLLRGAGDTHAAILYSRTSYAPAMNSVKLEETKSVNTNKVLPPIRNISLSEKKDDFSSIEDEKEDEDSSFARRYLLITKFFVTLACISVLSYLYLFTKNRLPRWRQFTATTSSKYILQRVLRI